MFKKVSVQSVVTSTVTNTKYGKSQLLASIYIGSYRAYHENNDY